MANAMVEMGGSVTDVYSKEEEQAEDGVTKQHSGDD